MQNQSDNDQDLIKKKRKTRKKKKEIAVIKIIPGEQQKSDIKSSKCKKQNAIIMINMNQYQC